MSCTPCTPPQNEFPTFCDPNPVAESGARLLVEDTVFCQRSLVPPEEPALVYFDGDKIVWQKVVIGPLNSGGTGFRSVTAPN